ncbi:hypothetical protein [Nocardioides alcanivorans]|nr:hypothetical protein [Nocardioides alcanivorans]
MRSGDRNHADTVSEALGKGLALAVVLEESSVRGDAGGRAVAARR